MGTAPRPPRRERRARRNLDSLGSTHYSEARARMIATAPFLRPRKPKHKGVQLRAAFEKPALGSALALAYPGYTTPDEDSNKRTLISGSLAFCSTLWCWRRWSRSRAWLRWWRR